MKEIVERFISYTRIDTTSVDDSEVCPSSPNQFILAHQLEEELKELLIEIEEEDETAILMEAIDVIIATETLLRQYPRELVDAAANMVYMKNRVRDYWEFPIDDEDDDDKE